MLIDIENYMDENIREEIKDIEIKSEISYNNTFSKAEIKYTIEYNGIIKKLSINKSEISIPSPIEGKYTVTTETDENGIYKLELVNNKNDYKINEANVKELVSDLKIYNVDELMSFRDKVNQGGTFEGKTVKLMENLNLENVCSEEIGDWIAIGEETKPFLGTFEGNGKEISNLYVKNEKFFQGLFGEIGDKGTVKNLTVEGNMAMAGIGGGIAGRNLGIIESCISNVEIHAKMEGENNAWRNGGIVGVNRGKVYKCMNIGNVEGEDATGGIAGLNAGIVSSCFNKGNIKSAAPAGGIVGDNGYSSNNVPEVKGKGKIYNCYNIGNAESQLENWDGGIVGANGFEFEDAESYIYNCYSINIEKIYGKNYNEGNIINCYTTDVKNKIQELNEGIEENGENSEQPWIEDTEGINNGYPILDWQKH